MTNFDLLEKFYNSHKNDLAERLKIFQVSIDGYNDRRGAMVIDVICSRRRNYEKRVLAMVDKWSKSVESPSLEFLAKNGAEFANLGLMKGENKTLIDTAKGLIKFGKDFNVQDENEICFRWADFSNKYLMNYFLDPYVGSVKGIGFALFSYLRLLSGADTIKIDSRVINCLNFFGFETDKKPEQIYLNCLEIANKLQVSLRELDQLFWGVAIIHLNK